MQEQRIRIVVNLFRKTRGVEFKIIQLEIISTVDHCR
jgi:hypothetical protein